MAIRITDPKKDVALLNRALQQLEKLQQQVSQHAKDILALKGKP